MNQHKQYGSMLRQLKDPPVMYNKSTEQWLEKMK